jgi:hypothetical protein
LASKAVTHKRRRLTVILITVCLLLSAACSFGRGATPSVIVDSMQAKPGTTLRVAGQSWRPGERVVIGLAAPDSSPRDSEEITTALADAAGNFVALFVLPTDDPWANMPEIWLVAHSPDFGRVAIGTFSRTMIPTAAATVIPIASATPSAPPAVYVLGHVENVAASARVIKVAPIEGQAETIVILGTTQIQRNGQPAQLTDIQIGDLIESTGQASPTAVNTILADVVRILAPSAEPTATLTPTQPALVWQGEYYANTTFSGNPLVARADPVIDFQWQAGAAADGLPLDNFAVRWTGSWPFERGAYHFNAQVDDGVRVWLDDHLILDQWHESTGALYGADAYLSAGSHLVKVEYFDGQGSAHARVWWEYRGPDAVLAYPDWEGTYYSNATLSDPPFLVVNDRTPDFDWGRGPPAFGMPEDDFSVKWTRSVTWREGIYRVYALADDGVRVWVDETPVIDEWRETGVQTYAGQIYLTEGEHLVRVEYFEHTGVAVIAVWWELRPATPTPTHTSLPPTDTPLPPTETPTHTPEPPEATATATSEFLPVTPSPSAKATLQLRPNELLTTYLPLAIKPVHRQTRTSHNTYQRRGGLAAAW